MGKRKAQKAPPKRTKPKLDTAFNCPFCNSAKSVTCTISRQDKIGTAECTVCHESFSTPITDLDEAIDVYSEWIDQCERVN